jgi:hypothetical protein
MKLQVKSMAVELDVGHQGVAMDPNTALQLADGEHAVRFYEDEEHLASLVVTYLARSLTDGHTVVVIATKHHYRKFVDGLMTIIDPPILSRQLRVFDAEETLERFMVDGRPDAAAFDASVGGIIRDVGGSGHHVRAYGEMVALLWAKGNITGAIQLEGLWNNLCAVAPLSLLCSYPAGGWEAPDRCAGFSEVCLMHSEVVDGAPFAYDAEVSRRFPPSSHTPRFARMFVGETLTAWGLRHVIPDCNLVVSELATNAVRHARSDLTVSLSQAGNVIRVSVGDSSEAPPAVGAPGVARPDGYGLPLVDQLTAGWGHYQRGSGKLVWAHLSTAE